MKGVKFLEGNKWLYVAVIAVVAICALLLNVFAIPAHDELSYAFMGQSTSMNGFCPRIASLADIVRQQTSDYVRANGRVFVHGLVALFAGFRLYYLFDVINTLMWFLFVYLVLSEGKVKIAWEQFARGCLVVFLFWWYDETVSMNAAFGVNYLWMACATILIMKLWRNLNCWLWMPIGFIYGWGQETFSLPMIAALAGSAMLRSIKGRRYVLTAKQTIFLLFMIIGALGLISSPGIHARAGKSFDMSILSFAIAVVKWFAGLLLAGYPVLLLALIIAILWKPIKDIGRLIYADLEWWLFFAAAFALSLLLCKNGLYRICSGWLMAGLVLVFMHLKRVMLESSISKLICGLAMVLLVFSAVIQILYGLANNNMLKIYVADRQGITHRTITPSVFCHNICSFGIYNPWHLSIFRQEYRKDVSPTILSDKLYSELYQEPSAYFTDATEESKCYYNPKYPDIVVKKGVSKFSLEEQMRYEDMITPKGWKRFLPGRFKTMFPTDTYYVMLPRNPCSFIALDGNWYTICKLGEKLSNQDSGK